MKKSTLFICLLFTAIGFAQIDYGNQVKKNDVKKGLITFEKSTDNNGVVTFGFKMEGKPVGAQMILSPTGITTYLNCNKDNHIDGTTLIMDKNSGEISLYTYRKSKKDGPAFKMANGKILWNKQFKDDKATGKEYEVNHSFDYYTRSGSSFEGFTMEKYKESYALGYFAYGKRAYPIIHVWNDGDQFYGQCIQGLRKEFGVYFYADGSKYIGAWDDNYREGLGFKVDKNGAVIEKGFYKGGKLEISI
jgi:hypothetical protein